MKPESLTISNRGTPLTIETLGWNCGKEKNPVLVFLHEGLGAAGSWKFFPEKLGEKTGCNAFAYSRPGYGGSSPITLPRKINYLHTEALQVLPQILEAAHIDRYILIGHSDGGSIALVHGGGHPAHGLGGIITLAAHLFCEPVTRQGLKKAKEWYETGDLRQRLEPIHGSNTDTAFWGWNTRWLSPEFSKWNIEKFMKTIKVPTLALQGVQDPYATLAQLDAMKSGIKSSKIHAIDNCRHIPHFEQPEQTFSLISDFILSTILSTA